MTKHAIELGIDRFVFSTDGANGAKSNPVPDLLEEIVRADQLGINAYGIGEHHTSEFSDSSPPVLLAAAAAKTENIRLSSAITILSAADPVRVFEEFATLDLISGGRAEIVAGRGAYAEAFTLFGMDLAHYDDLYREKLDLLLKLRRGDPVHWSGRHRPPLNGQIVYPRPIQAELPIWVGATGSAESFERAGRLGLPLALGTIGGSFARLRPLIDLYRNAGARAGHDPKSLRIAIHAIGYVSETTQQAREEFYPSYYGVFSKIGRQAGWPELTPSRFDQMTAPSEALVVGSARDVAMKIASVDEMYGGIDRFCLQMSVGQMRRDYRLRTIELLAGDVRKALT